MRGDGILLIGAVTAAVALFLLGSALCGLAPDLPWLIGYEAMPLERLTMLVIPVDDDPTLVVPNLEVPRVVPEEGFAIAGWGETEDPIALVLRNADAVVGDRQAQGVRLLGQPYADARGAGVAGGRRRFVPRG